MCIFRGGQLILLLISEHRIKKSNWWINISNLFCCRVWCRLCVRGLSCISAQAGIDFRRGHHVRNKGRLAAIDIRRCGEILDGLNALRQCRDGFLHRRHRLDGLFLHALKAIRHIAQRSGQARFLPLLRGFQLFIERGQRFGLAGLDPFGDACNLLADLFDCRGRPFLALYNALVETICQLFNFAADLLKGLIFAGFQEFQTLIQRIGKPDHFFAQRVGFGFADIPFRRVRAQIKVLRDSLDLLADLLNGARLLVLCCSQALIDTFGDTCDSVSNHFHGLSLNIFARIQTARKIINAALDPVQDLRINCLCSSLDLLRQLCACERDQITQILRQALEPLLKLLAHMLVRVFTGKHLNIRQVRIQSLKSSFQPVHGLVSQGFGAAQAFLDLVE